MNIFLIIWQNYQKSKMHIRKKNDKNRKIGKFSLTLLNKKTKMSDWQQRTRLLVGEEAAARLRAAHVLIVGVGGVGAYRPVCQARGRR